MHDMHAILSVDFGRLLKAIYEGLLILPHSLHSHNNCLIEPLMDMAH